MLYTTKTLTRDGITYTAEFSEPVLRVTAFKLSAAGQEIDLFRDAPKATTEEVRDSWFIKTHPALSRLADEVYERGTEVFSEVERAA